MSSWRSWCAGTRWRRDPRARAAGLTVVSLEQAVAAPFATRQLADLGARVIKVERAGAGDFAVTSTGPDGQASYFVWLNRGKQSIELDIKDPDDREVLDALLGRADVLCTTSRPGRPGASGWARPTCSDVIRGWSAARSPGTARTARIATRRPTTCSCNAKPGCLGDRYTGGAAKAPISVADISAGMYAYSGVLTALYERERTGEGTSLEVAMLDALGEWMSQPVYTASTAVSLPGGRGPGTRPSPLTAPMPWPAGSRFPRPPERPGMGRAVREDPQPAGPAPDDRFATNPDRVAHDEELTPISRRRWRPFPLRTLSPRWTRPVSRTPGCARPRSSPRIRSSRRDRGVRWTRRRSVRALLPPVNVPGREATMGAVPALGQHTDAIRAELGLPPRIGPPRPAEVQQDKAQGHEIARTTRIGRNMTAPSQTGLPGRTALPHFPMVIGGQRAQAISGSGTRPLTRSPASRGPPPPTPMPPTSTWPPRGPRGIVRAVGPAHRVRPGQAAAQDRRPDRAGRGLPGRAGDP